MVTAASNPMRSNGKVKTKLSKLVDRLPETVDLGLLRRRQTYSNHGDHGTRQQAQVIAETLATIGLPAAVIGVRGEVLVANDLFVALVPGMLRKLQGRLRLTNVRADHLIENSFARLNSSTHARAAGCIAIRAQSGALQAVATFIPMRRAANDIVIGAAGVVLVNPVKPGRPPDAKTLQRLFKLSPAEARIARSIATCETIEAIAEGSGVSRETIRSQLKNVLAKTGTKRQLDLAVLLVGLRLPEDLTHHPFG
jgi:DNA-binding CsgD family transcriptional regulator